MSPQNTFLMGCDDDGGGGVGLNLEVHLGGVEFLQGLC